MEKKLYKSDKNKMIAGICGGIAEYLNCDPTIIRIVAVILLFMNLLGLMAYIVLCFVVPSKDGEDSFSKSDAPHFKSSSSKREDSEFDSYFKD